MRHGAGQILSDPTQQGTAIRPHAHEQRGETAESFRLAAQFARQMCSLGEALPVADRALVAAVYRDGRTIPELAALMKRPPHAVRRRLARLVARLIEPDFAYVLAHRHGWPEDLAAVGTLCVIEGVSQRAAATRLGLSEHVVRQKRGAIRVLASSAPGAGSKGAEARWREPGAARDPRWKPTRR